MLKRAGILLFLFSAGAVYGASSSWNAMDWIDGDAQHTTPSWQQQLGINETRLSCRVTIRNTPAKCVSYVSASPTPGIQKYFLYVSPDAATLQADAKQYSSLISPTSTIDSIGVDDFFGSYEVWYKQMPNASQFIGQVIDNLKSVNHNLKFGITLYENELDPVANPYIDDRHLPQAIKDKFDYIHLYLHYRKNGPWFAQYVAQAQAYFPKAKIIAGVYTYDRIDYFPCAQNDPTKKPCTEEEEINYFKQALDIQVQLLKQGDVAALELFPGYFGNENALYGPKSDNLACKDVSRCVQNTITMRDAALAAHQQFMAIAAPTTSTSDSLAGMHVFPNPWRADQHDHHPVTFNALPSSTTVKIYTLSGHLIQTLTAADTSVVWDMTNDHGATVASGLYLYLVTAPGGQTARGQLAVIR